jgi:hypothetical protein
VEERTLPTTSESARNATAEDRRFIEEHDGLSDSTKRARWIHSTDEHADHPGETLATRSHDVIRAWAEARDGKPATVEGSSHGGRPGVLRIDFRGGSSLKEISWDEWFESFDARDLVFLYQEQLKSGDQSNFFQLDNPTREDG